MKADLESLNLLKQIYQPGNAFYDSEHSLTLYRLPASVSQEELGKLGLQPNQLVQFNHDSLLQDFKKLANRWSMTEAAAAYLAGLYSADYSWQAILISKILADKLPIHDFQAYGNSLQTCKICGFEETYLNATEVVYQAITSGPAIEGSLQRLYLTLRHLENQTPPQPSPYDIWLFRKILTEIRQAPAGKSYTYIRDRIKKAKLFANPSAYLISALLENLSMIGILDTQDHPGLWQQYSTYIERDQRPSVRVEVQAPLAWWSTSDGVNETNLLEIFQGLDLSNLDESDQDLSRPNLKDTLVYQWQRKRLPRKSSPKSPHAGRGPAQAGDVYGIRLSDDRWVTCYCHAIDRNRVLVEFLQGSFAEFPSKNQLILKTKQRYDGSIFQQKTSGMDRTSGVKRIARNLKLAEEPQIVDFPTYGNPADLKRMAENFFEWGGRAENFNG